MIKLIVKWAAWIVSALSLLLVFFGFMGYILGNVQIMGAWYYTYLMFSQYMSFSAIILILLHISLKEK